MVVEDCNEEGERGRQIEQFLHAGWAVVRGEQRNNVKKWCEKKIIMIQQN